jgi:tetratricopeptide (TPR) repeat protein
MMTLACSPSPRDQKKRQKKSNPDQVMIQKLTHDAEFMKRSYFVMLGQDSQTIRRWEESEGLIQFFQGKLTSAVDTLGQELQESSDSTLMIAQVRALIELAETYGHLIEIESHLLPLWLSYERGRPNASVHLAWYDWVELVALISRSGASPDKSATYHARIDELKTKLAQAPEMKLWGEFALDLTADVPNKPQRPKASYQRWVKFARAVKEGKLDQAREVFKKLKLKKPMLKLPSGKTGSSLKIYDPRITKSLKDFYSQEGLQICQKIELEGYYCGRLHELQGDLTKARVAYQRAQAQLATLITNAKDTPSTSHLVLSTHTDLSGIQDELEARLKSLEEQVSASAAPTQTPPKQAVTPSSNGSKSPVSSLSSPQEFWRHFQDPELLSTQHLFPRRRGALSLLASAALEASKGPAINDVGMFGLVDRWLDELHYRYARLLIDQDDRVSAMKTLNAAEEVKFGARLGGRNRLTRLLLSAYTYLKMNQQRVTVKYLRRLQNDLPALSFALGMTSDVLSGKSFEQKEGSVTSGQ